MSCTLRLEPGGRTSRSNRSQQVTTERRRVDVVTCTVMRVSGPARARNVNPVENTMVGPGHAWMSSHLWYRVRVSLHAKVWNLVFVQGAVRVRSAMKGQGSST